MSKLLAPQSPDQTVSLLVIPLVIAFHGALALMFRNRFGDREQETTSADERKQVGNVIDSLIHGNPSKSPVLMRFMTTNSAARWLPSLEYWHGWLSPQGYAIFMVFNTPASFHENVITAMLHLRRICVIDRERLLITPEDKHRRFLRKVKISTDNYDLLDGAMTPDSLANYRLWKTSTPA